MASLFRMADTVLLGALLVICGVAMLFGAGVARARLRRALLVAAAPPGAEATFGIPSAPQGESPVLARRRAPARHEYDLMIGRTFFH